MQSFLGRMQRKYNFTRLNVYEQLFEAVIKGEQDECVAANLLIDIRWLEVSRAFVNCVASNSCTNTLRPLADDLRRLVSRAAEQAFGTCQHSEIPSWFLQNNECFLASCLHKLLRTYTRQPALAPHQMRQAIEALFDAAEALKPFLGLEYLARSSSAHALMSATAHSRYDFLKSEECVSSAPALCFAEMLAERILAQPGRALKLESPFCFFARSERWQQFAARCVDCFSPDESFARLQRQAVEYHSVKKPKDERPGLFFLASAFLEAEMGASASPPASPKRTKRRAVATVTPIKKHPLVARKHSGPFVNLVQRLLAGSQA